MDTIWVAAQYSRDLDFSIFFVGEFLEEVIQWVESNPMYCCDIFRIKMGAMVPSDDEIGAMASEDVSISPAWKNARDFYTIYR